MPIADCRLSMSKPKPMPIQCGQASSPLSPRIAASDADPDPIPMPIPIRCGRANSAASPCIASPDPDADADPHYPDPHPGAVRQARHSHPASRPQAGALGARRGGAMRAESCYMNSARGLRGRWVRGVWGLSR